MTEPPKAEDDKLPEPEAEERFNRLVGKLVTTPHTPHVPKKRRGRTAPPPESKR